MGTWAPAHWELGEVDRLTDHLITGHKLHGVYVSSVADLDRTKKCVTPW